MVSETWTFYVHGEISSQKITAERSREGKSSKAKREMLKYCMGFSVSVFGAVCAINDGAVCAINDIYWFRKVSDLPAAISYFSLTAFFTCWAIDGLAEMKPQVFLT